MIKREWPRAVAAAAVTILFVLPLFFLVSGALRRPGLAPPDGFEWIPPARTWSNYSFANDIIPLGGYALNSLLVVIVAVPLTVLIASWAGFAIATAEPATRKRLVVIRAGADGAY